MRCLADSLVEVIVRIAHAELTIHREARVRIPEGEILPMPRARRGLDTKCIGAMTGPSVVGRISDHARAHRIQFDVPVTLQQLRPILDQA